MLRLIQILVFLSPFSIFAQVNIINRSLTDTSLAYAYVGVDNAIELTGYKVNNSILISITRGTIMNLGQNRYVLRISIPGECVLTFTDKGKVIAKRTFKVDELAEPRIRLAGVRDSVASVNQILVNPFLIIEIPGSYLKHRLVVTRFMATFVGQNFDSLETFAAGNIFTQEQINIIKQLHSGDRIFFSDIYFLGPDSRRRKFPPFTIIIK